MLQAHIGALAMEATSWCRAASLFGETLWRGEPLAVLRPSTESPEMDRWLHRTTRCRVIEKLGQPLGGTDRYGFRHALMLRRHALC